MKKKYIVNPDEELVVAMVDTNEFISNVDDEIEMYCSENTQKLLNDFLLADRIGGNPKLDILRNSKFKSVARCDEFDSFSEKVGKTIAGSKVDIKYHKAMAKKYEAILKALNNSIIEINNLYNKHNVKARNIEKSIDKYLKKQRVS